MKVCKSRYVKKNQNCTFLNGLSLRYYPVNRQTTVQYKDIFELAIPTEINQLELPNFMLETQHDAQKGHIIQSAWENPEIKDLDKALTGTTLIGLSYHILLNFLNLQGTRDIWLNFPGLHHSLISYMRNRAIITPMLMQYKIAMLSCCVNNYTLHDLAKIERTFERHGLSRQNAIFYILFAIEKRQETIDFDTDDICVLTMPDMEEEITTFLNQTSTFRLCRYHVAKKLLFIVESNRYSKDEMTNELMVATQIAYSIIRPFKSKLYSENYARRSMTNMVNRIIHAYTNYDSKIRIINKGNEYENTHISLANLSVSALDATYDPIQNSMLFSEDHMISYLDSKSAA